MASKSGQKAGPANKNIKSQIPSSKQIKMTKIQMTKMNGQIVETDRDWRLLRIGFGFLSFEIWICL